jgi:23S rRNA pseudouridine1911/1915/1917 synthase
VKKKRKRKGPGPATPKAREAREKPSYSKKLPILFEDDAIIVINKPASLPAVPIQGSSTPSALSLLNALLKTKKQQAQVVHRIDRFTSGIILFAKTDSDRDDLIKQFLAHTPVREYLAVIKGKPKADSGMLIHFFKREEQRQILSNSKDKNAAKAKLFYRVEEHLHQATLVRVSLDTGLQNQIRAQFLAEGHPLIGDRKYNARGRNEERIDRVALHAQFLSFKHPRTGEKFAIECDLPLDIRSLIQDLRPRR